MASTGQRRQESCGQDCWAGQLERIARTEELVQDSRDRQLRQDNHSRTALTGQIGQVRQERIFGTGHLGQYH